MEPSWVQRDTVIKKKIQEELCEVDSKTSVETWKLFQSVDKADRESNLETGVTESTEPR